MPPERRRPASNVAAAASNSQVSDCESFFVLRTHAGGTPGVPVASAILRTNPKSKIQNEKRPTNVSRKSKIQNPKSSGCYLHLLDFRMVVHEQILFPFRTRLGVMTKQYVIESEPEKLLRCQQRHARLFGRAITFSLITFHTRCDEIRRRTFSALSTGKNVIEC